MSKTSAIIGMIVTFLGGIAVGNLAGGGDSDSAPSVRVAENRGTDSAEDAPAAAAAAGEVERFRVEVTDAQPSKGPADALVTIVEFSEFECPFCSRVNPTITRIMEEYGDDVRVVWRNNPLPFHQNAGPAAAAALEARAQGGNDKFWEMHDLLFQNQRALGREDLERYATQLGLNMDRFRAALDNNTHQAAITADQNLARQIGARGTPNFFINGRNLRGAQPFERFKALIDEELATARGLVENGTARGEVYASLTRNGRTTPAPAPQQPAAAQKNRPARPQPDPAAVYRVPIEGDQPTKGPDDALVTIVEVSDFECPFCSRVNPTIAQIIEEYGDDVRVVWFNNPLPFHRNAPAAHAAALEAFDQQGDDGFWRFHDTLFQNQRALTRADLERYAEEQGLNMAQFRQALDNDEHQETIESQQRLAQSLGARGTPSFFINGRNVRGAQPFPAFKRVIDEELARARELVSNGTPRSGVYAAAIADGATEAQFLAAPAGAQAAQKAAPARPDADRVYEIPVPDDRPGFGPANAQVVIQEFTDFQCPFCNRVLPTLQQIKEQYGDRVRLVFRNYPLPFHQQAPLAHQAAMEVFRQGGNDKFWAYHDVLFQNMRALERADLERYAQELGGINMAQFRQALDTERHAATVQADMNAIQEAGARIGTPSFFINGRLLQGAQPFPAFQAAIDRALEEAGR